MKAEASLPKIVIVGSGNVAWVLGKSLKNSGVEIAGIVARNEETGIALASELGVPFFRFAADVLDGEKYFWILAVQDQAIAAARQGIPLNAKLVAHTSGTAGLMELKEFTNPAVFYILQTMKKGVTENLKNAAILLESDHFDSLEIMQQISDRLNAKSQIINSDQRAALHLAAVFACNFSNQLLAISAEILSASKLDLQLLKPLMEQTISNAFTAEHPQKVQTGPAMRGDQATLDKHLARLQDFPEWQNLYAHFSKLIEASKHNK